MATAKQQETKGEPKPSTGANVNHLGDIDRDMPEQHPAPRILDNLFITVPIGGGQERCVDPTDVYEITDQANGEVLLRYESRTGNHAGVATLPKGRRAAEVARDVSHRRMLCAGMAALNQCHPDLLATILREAVRASMAGIAEEFERTVGTATKGYLELHLAKFVEAEVARVADLLPDAAQ